jgi:protein-tyrosine phosphatase
MDISWLLSNLRADRSDPNLATLPLHRVAAEIRHALLLRERSDTLVVDDPAPGLLELARIAARLPRGIARRVRSRFAKLPFLRSVRARKARERLDAASSVLFVCKGNICRSPFAARYASHVLHESMGVSSCGYYPESGRVSPQDAVLAARSYSIDLSDHRSSEISAEDVRNADIVFVFDQENLDRIRSDYSFARSKTFLLGTLAPESDPVIPDPFGGTSSDFRDCYRRIALLIDAWSGRVDARDPVQTP